MPQLYPVSFDFAPLTLIVLTLLRNSLNERFKINSVETVSDVSEIRDLKKGDQKVKRIKNGERITAVGMLTTAIKMIKGNKN